jgi:flagellin-like protein
VDDPERARGTCEDRAISPIVATVLLVTLAIATAFSAFPWMDRHRPDQGAMGGCAPSPSLNI